MKYMNELIPGADGMITKVSVRDELLTRFGDLGIIEGTKIRCVGKSPGGDPRAYLIRGSVIAIRADDCKDIEIDEL